MPEIPPDALFAIKNGNLPALQEWVNRSSGNLQAKDNNGETLMHKAAYHGQPLIMAWLVEQGFSIEIKDNQGFNPLHEAARGNKPASIAWLLEQGADAAAKNSNGRTARELIGEKNADNTETINLLLQAGAKPVWQRIGADEVVCVTPKPILNRTITEVFNFSAKTYLLINVNNETKAESTVFRTFSDFGDDQLLNKAEKEFTRLGGKMPDVVDLDKPKVKLPGRNLP
jgi:ankyrin repeat protein